MGGHGKRKWKISIYRSSSSSSESKQEMKEKEPPQEFICPVSDSLMHDPVIVSSGQTFESTVVQVCSELGFSPILHDGSKSDFSTVIPNLALKSSIRRWCDSCSHQYPQQPDYLTTLDLVRSIMASTKEGEDNIRNSIVASSTKEGEDDIRNSEMDLLKAVAEMPPAVKLFSHAATDLNPQTHHLYSSSSSEESVIANLPLTILLPFTTRPVCYSSSSSYSTSSDMEVDEARNASEDEEFVAMMRSGEVFNQEQGVIKLRDMTRSKEESRISLCTPKLLSALRPLLLSRYGAMQTNAAAAVVNLSLEKSNKVKIVRSGIVPPLIDLLKGGLIESQEHAAGALFSLALEDNNKTAIGVLGGLQPLLHALRIGSERTRQDSAMALYHLSLVQSNRVKLAKLSTIPTLLQIAGSNNGMASRCLLILCNMAACPDGRSAMLDAGAVKFLVDLLRKGNNGEVSESIRENCVAALFSLSQGSLRFKGLLAKEARAVEALRQVVERGSERGKEKANRILKMLRARALDESHDDEEGELEPDWERVMSGMVGRNNNSSAF